MKKLALLSIGSVLILILTSCNTNNKYIIPADFSTLVPDLSQISNGIKGDQLQKRIKEFLNTLRTNTIGHEIPDITIYDLTGKSWNLKNELNDKKVIIASRLTCAWDMEGILKDFPEANRLVKTPINSNEIVLLIQKENNDYFDQQFNKNIEKIKSIYSNIFLIDSLQSLKINIYGLSRYYISREHIVLDIGRGTSPSTSNKFLINEIERNTTTNNSN